jgi:hypothetical protein
MMVNTVDLKKKLYDIMADFRDMAIKGKLDNRPRTIKDPQSKNTSVL